MLLREDMQDMLLQHFFEEDSYPVQDILVHVYISVGAGDILDEILLQSLQTAFHLIRHSSDILSHCE